MTYAKAVAVPAMALVLGIFSFQVAEATYCGNGITEPQIGETCDDGNQNNHDGCSSSCQTEDPVCGDGKVEGNEVCDDGNANDGDNCSNACKPKEEKKPICGNGIKETGETCDDGNGYDKDECDNTCRPNDDDDDDDDDKKKKKKPAKTIPATGLPVAGVAGLVLSTAGLYLTMRRLKRNQ